MTVELKPCPFCGGRRLRVKPVWQTYRFVACLDCKAGGPVRKTEAEAVESWDGRREPEPLQPPLWGGAE